MPGAVIVADPDPRRQLPVPDVKISAAAGGMTVHAKSDSSGLFHLDWPRGIWPGEEVKLIFRRQGYQDLELDQPFRGQIWIGRMKPLPSASSAESHTPEVLVSDIRARYAVKAATTINIGSIAKTFQVENTGNIPCNRQAPCSPDGKWKATIASISFDAGEGHEFQAVRVSCIAGPCPFTRIESDQFSHGGRKISISVRAWSYTVTFLVEAEVVHTMLSDVIRQAYPSIYDKSMTFTLPETGQGPSIEAEVGGADIVFPLGPDLDLSWASCSLKTAQDGTKLYTCQLKPGYRFRDSAP